MFGFCTKKGSVRIKSVTEALSLVDKIKTSGTIDDKTSGIKTKIKLTDEERSDPALFIKNHFTPEESSYYCEGKYFKKNKKGSTKHVLQLSYISRLLVGDSPVLVGFASCGFSLPSSENRKQNIEPYLIKKATIELYVK